MNDMFEVTMNIIGVPCLGMNIVFIKIRSLYQDEIPIGVKLNIWTDILNKYEL